MVINYDKSKEISSIGFLKIKIIEDNAYSGGLIFTIKEKKILEYKFRINQIRIPKYFPTILFLNQTENYLNLIKDFSINPDCYILNSSGQIHPYFFGAACDFGLNISKPVVGYTNKLLFGEKRENDEILEVPKIYQNDQLIGYAIPKPNSKKYYFISVGNNISLQTARDLFLKIDLTIIKILDRELNEFIKNSKG